MVPYGWDSPRRLGKDWKMAFERQWPAVAPQAFTANGTQFGLITVANTAGLKVKQSAYLQSDTKPTIAVQVKRVLSKTQLVVGSINNSQIGSWPPLDISAYTLIDNASIGAEQQEKNKIQRDDVEISTYESDPTVARRVIFVDQYGNFYDANNPLPATFSGTISVGEVIIKGTNNNTIEPNPDGSLNVIITSPSPTINGGVTNTYNQVSSVVSGATTQLVTYTIPSGKKGILQRAAVSGENIARYDLLINGNPQDTTRTMFGGDLTQVFDFTTGNDSGLALNTGDVITVQVLHNRPSSGTFNARIQVLIIT